MKLLPVLAFFAVIAVAMSGSVWYHLNPEQMKIFNQMEVFKAKGLRNEYIALLKKLPQPDEVKVGPLNDPNDPYLEDKVLGYDPNKKK